MTDPLYSIVSELERMAALAREPLTGLAYAELMAGPIKSIEAITKTGTMHDSLMFIPTALRASGA